MRARTKTLDAGRDAGFGEYHVSLPSSDRVPRLFILSPAHCGGRRAKQALAPGAAFPLAEGLRSRAGVPLGDLFSFVSGLYFRGKLTYARRFVLPPLDEGTRGNAVVGDGIYIITPTAGLRTPETPVTERAVREFACGDIDLGNAAYRRPLEASAEALAREIGDAQVVLLGSIASPKYVDILLGIFGTRLLFPAEFVGRGDMSRGGLLLRRAAEGVELDYIPVAGAARRGTRPPRLPPLCLAR